jgi:hypothetical protein
MRIFIFSFISVIFFSSCKTKKINFREIDNFVLPAYNISNTDFNKIFYSVKERKNVIVLFNKKEYPFDKLDSLTKKLNSDFSFRIEKDSILKRKIIFIEKLK